MLATTPPSVPRRLAASAVSALVLPLLIWLVTSFAAPVVGAALGHGDAVVAWLAEVESREARAAAIATPSIDVGSRALVVAAWPYHRARATVDAALPRGDALFAATAGRGAAERILAAVGAWVGDRFVPVQRHWCAIALTRLWYALAILVSAVPAIALAFVLGEWRARCRRERGDQPLGHRYRWWATTGRLAVAAAPAVIVAPAPCAAVPVLIALAIVATVATAGARAHAMDL